MDNGYLDLYPEFILPPDQKEAYNNELQAAVVGKKLAKRFGWSLGDHITITGTIFSGDWDFIIRGIYSGKERTTDETTMFFHWKRVDERLRSFGRDSQVGWWLIGISDPGVTGTVSKEVDSVHQLVVTDAQGIVPTKRRSSRKIPYPTFAPPPFPDSDLLSGARK